MKKKLLKLIGIFVSATLVVSSSNALYFISFAEGIDEGVVIEENSEEIVEESKASRIEDEVVGEKTEEESVEEQTDLIEPVKEQEEPVEEPIEEETEEIVEEPSEELDYVLGRPMTEEELAEQEAIIKEYAPTSGYVSPGDEYRDLLYSGDNAYAPRVCATYEPTLDNSNYVTAIRNQNPYGTCWAHSTIACAEIYLKKHGIVPMQENLDLSELHLAYYANNLSPDPLGNSEGDTVTFSDGSFLNLGGNGIMAKDALSNWRGFAPEGTITASDILNGTINNNDTALAYTDTYHLTEFAIIPYRNANNVVNMDMMKQHIKEYGAVSISYSGTITNNENYKGGNYKYYNYNTASQYCDIGYVADHAVTIVGWDDNYSVNNFGSCKPSNPGAWKVLNSWGLGFGKQGYFYISYEDATIDNYVYVFAADLANDYDFNYQYDHNVDNYGDGVVKAANIYEVKGNNGGAERLDAVAFDTYEANVSYTVRVYKNPTKSATGVYNPESGEKVAEQAGSARYTGYHQIKLTTPVVLNSGDIYSVVFDFSKDSNGFAYLERENNYNAGGTTTGKQFTNSSNKSGQSYKYNGAAWSDTSYMGGNYAIKAFTTKYESIACTGVSINNKSNLSVNVGDTINLTATVTPSNATNKKLIWESLDTTKATVSEDGVVTGVSETTGVTIRVKTVDGGFMDTCTVKVTNLKYDYIDSVTLNKNVLNMWQGDATYLIPTLTPGNVTDNSVTWTSSNKNVATVSANGKVTAVGSGSATITCTTKLSGKTATCTVNVNEHPTGVTLDKTSIEIDLGVSTTAKLTATVLPATAYDQAVTWSSSNTNIATVDQNGNVVGRSFGTATITVKTADGAKTATCEVKVTRKVKSVSLTPSTLSMNVGETVGMWPTIYPSNAENKSVTWSSSNSGVATVDASGRISAKAPGTAVITVKTVDGGKTATCTVTVDNKLMGIQIKVTNPVIYVGDTFTPSVTYTPANPTDVVWSSSDTKVATVSAKGVVTGLSAGTSTIKVGNKEGSISSTYTITVRAKSTPAPTPTYSYTIKMSVPSGYSSNEIYVDGIAYQASITNGNYVLTLPNGNAKSVVAYKYNEKGTQKGMYVWTLKYVGYEYVVTPQPELQDLLTYNGFSIRITGKSGIRYQTGISIDKRKKLINEGLNGYKLTEYGTLVMNEANRKKLPMILGGSKTNSAVAYGYDSKGNWINKVYAKQGSEYIYTAVLVGLDNSQYKTELAFRGYCVLKNGNESITIYGAPVSRSLYGLSETVLGKGVYKPSSSEYIFLKKIIDNAK